MTKKSIFPSLVVLLSATVLLSSCKKESADTEYPVIDVDYPGSFPKNCVDVSRGGSFTSTIRVHDNVELGSMSVEIHENFDHHTHSTDVESCPEVPAKIPVNPFSAIVEFPLPAGQSSYTSVKDINIPAGVDTGRYHFIIRLTDKAGWQTIKGIEINIK